MNSSPHVLQDVDLGESPSCEGSSDFAVAIRAGNPSLSFSGGFGIALLSLSSRVDRMSSGISYTIFTSISGNLAD